MGAGGELSAAMGPLRWGLFLLLAAAVVAVAVPTLLLGFQVSVFGERVAVATFPAWSLPALDVRFSLPPEGEGASMAAWAAEQLANAAYGLAVLVYYAALAGMGIGAGLVGVALHRLSRSADALRR